MSTAALPSFPIEGFTAPGFEPLREAFARNLADGYEVGASFSAVLDGETVVDLWGGYRDAELTEPWQRDTLVNLYSTTKGLAAAAVAALAGEGALDYDAPVTELWPELAAGRNGLSIGRLLAHQGGLCGLRRRVTVADLYDWQRMIAWLEAEEPHWEPGTAAGYHAITWGYLPGELVRRVTGQTLGTVLAERIARPLEAEVFLGLPESEMERVATMIGPNRARAQPGAAAPGEKPRMRGSAELQMPPLYRIALENPVIRPYADVSTREWRRAEIAAANGQGNARGVARVYGALARDGELDGVRIMAPGAIDLARQEEPVRGRDLVLGRVMRRGRGFLLNSDGIYGPGSEAFGHSGAGGSVGFADPERRLGVGYAMNQMQSSIDTEPRAARLIEALYACP